MSEEELRPCPFCGGKNVLSTELQDGLPFIAYCQCGAENEAENWNNRPIEDKLRKRIAELEAGNTALKQHPQPIEFWSDEKKELYRRNESRTIKSGREEEREI